MIMRDIEEFVGGAIELVRKHGAELLKKANVKGYDYRAVAAYDLFKNGKLLKELPLETFPMRMVNFLGGSYYRTKWCVEQVRRCCFRRDFVVGFFREFHEFYLWPFVQALPLLYDSERAFEDVHQEDSDIRKGVKEGERDEDELHLLVGFDEDNSVRCALAPSYLVEDSSEAEQEAQQGAFADEVDREPYAFGASLMQFLITIARGTYALPLPALRKARRFAAKDDDPTSSPAAPDGAEGRGDSGPANGGTDRLDTTFLERLTFSSSTCNMLWLYVDRMVSPRARVGEHTILVSTFLISPCFRTLFRCAQGQKHLVGEKAQEKLLKNKEKAKLKDEFAKELVWLPVVVTVRGQLTTYDEPEESHVRVTYLDQDESDETDYPGWLIHPNSLSGNSEGQVSVACDDQYQVDGKIRLALHRPRRLVQQNAKLERCGRRWTPQRAVSVVVFVHGRLCRQRLTPPPPFHLPCRAPFAEVQGGGV